MSVTVTLSVTVSVSLSVTVSVSLSVSVTLSVSVSLSFLKLSICISHVTCHMSNAYVDPWEMLNNFCFHVYAQKSLVVGENGNGFFDISFHLCFFWTTAAPGPVTNPIIELVPS